MKRRREKFNPVLNYITSHGFCLNKPGLDMFKFIKTFLIRFTLKDNTVTDKNYTYVHE